MKYLLPLLLISLAVLNSCVNYEDEDYIEYFVIEAYLFSGEPFPEILFSTTNPAFESYSFEDVAVSGADIRIESLGGGIGSAPDNVITYSEFTQGVYLPDFEDFVEPGHTYRLVITAPDETEITAHTITPGAFELLTEDNQSVEYQGEEQLELVLTPSEYPGRQSIYIFTSIAQDTSVENLTPIYFDFFDSDDDLTLEDFRATSSGTLNEGNFTENEDGTINLDVPWLAIAFYGINDLIVSTVDDNVFDFVSSQETQLGGFSVSPGEIPNLNYNIDQAIGVFGSFTTDTIRTNILRPAE